MTSTNDDVLKEGWVQKRSRFLRQWRYRYIVLDRWGALAAFKTEIGASSTRSWVSSSLHLEDEEEAAPVTEDIDVRGGRVSECSFVDKPFGFEITTYGGIHFCFVAPSREERSRWITVLRQAAALLEHIPGATSAAALLLSESDGETTNRSLTDRQRMIRSHNETWRRAAQTREHSCDAWSPPDVQSPRQPRVEEASAQGSSPVAAAASTTQIGRKEESFSEAVAPEAPATPRKEKAETVTAAVPAAAATAAPAPSSPASADEVASAQSPRPKGKSKGKGKAPGSLPVPPPLPPSSPGKGKGIGGKGKGSKGKAGASSEPFRLPIGRRLTLQPKAFDVEAFRALPSDGTPRSADSSPPTPTSSAGGHSAVPPAPSEAPTGSVDFEALRNQFMAPTKEPKDQREQEEIMRRVATREKGVKLLPHIVAVNMGIALAYFEAKKIDTITLAAALARLDPAACSVTREQASILQGAWPKSPSDLRQLDDFLRNHGKESELRDVERQMVPLLRLPRMCQRLDLMVMATSLDDRISEPLDRLLELQQACVELRRSYIFRCLLAKVVRVYNYVNYGTQEGNQETLYGIDVQTLSRLSETKAFNGAFSGYHMLHFVVKALLDELPHLQVEQFNEELRHLATAAKISLEVITQDFQRLRADHQFVQEEIRDHWSSYDENHQPVELDVWAVTQEAPEALATSLPSAGSASEGQAPQPFRSRLLSVTTLADAERKVEAAVTKREGEVVQPELEQRKATEEEQHGLASSNAAADREPIAQPEAQPEPAEHAGEKSAGVPEGSGELPRLPSLASFIDEDENEEWVPLHLGPRGPWARIWSAGKEFASAANEWLDGQRITLPHPRAGWDDEEEHGELGSLWLCTASQQWQLCRCELKGPLLLLYRITRRRCTDVIYAVLPGSVLRPFTAEDASPTSKELFASGASHGFELRQCRPPRVFYLAAATPKDAAKWYEALQTASDSRGFGQLWLHSASDQAWFGEDWQSGYFMVDSGLLLAYRRPIDVASGACPRRVWALCELTCRSISNPNVTSTARWWAGMVPHGFELQAATGVTWQFACSSAEDEARWMEVLQGSCRTPSSSSNAQPGIRIEPRPSSTSASAAPHVQGLHSGSTGKPGRWHSDDSWSGGRRTSGQLLGSGELGNNLLCSSLENFLAPVNEDDLHTFFGTPSFENQRIEEAEEPTTPTRVGLKRNSSIQSDPTGDVSDALVELRKRPSPLRLRPTSLSFSFGHMPRCAMGRTASNSSVGSTGSAATSPSPAAPRVEEEECSGDDTSSETQRMHEEQAGDSSSSDNEAIGDWDDDYRPSTEEAAERATAKLVSHEEADRCVDRLSALERRLAAGIADFTQGLESTEEDCRALLNFFGYELPEDRSGLASMMTSLLEALEVFRQQVNRSWMELRDHEAAANRQRASGSRTRVERRRTCQIPAS